MTTEPFEPAAPEPDPIPETVPTADAAPATVAVQPGAPAARPKGARSSGVLVNAILAAAFIVLVGGVGFAVGRATTPAAAAPGSNSTLQGGVGFPNGDGQAQGGPGQFPGDAGGDDLGRLRGGLSIQGTVVSISSTSITLKLADGRTVDVAITSSTGYHRQAAASAGDVTAGSTVIVNVAGLGPNAQGSGPTAGSITIVK